MKNIFIFLRFTITSLMVCLVCDFISNKKLILNKQQFFTSMIIAIILGIVFTFIFFYKTYTIGVQDISLEKIKEELKMNGFSIITENATYLCFGGNISYAFFVGNIKIDIFEREIKISGTRYILDKIAKNMSKK